MLQLFFRVSWLDQINTNLLSAIMQSGQCYQYLSSKEMLQLCRSSHKYKYEDYLILESNALVNLPEVLFCVLFPLFGRVKY